jgi:hypothetical protein
MTRHVLRFSFIVLSAAVLVPLMGATAPRQIDFTGTLSMPARLPDGRLISLIAEARSFKELDQEGPEQAAFRRLSSDNGNTWSEPERVFTYPGGKGTVVPQIYPLVDNDGILHAFNVHYYVLPKGRTPGHSVLLHCTSKDSGKTWTTPHPVNFGHDYTGAINSIIQLKSGRILGALSYSSDNFIESVGQREFRIVTFHSDDKGQSWQVGQDNVQVPFGPQVVHPGAIEPVMLELSPNRIWMIIRTQTLRFYEAFSTDGGHSFTEPKASAFMAPDSPGAILRLANGDLLFCWNDIASYPKGVAGHYRQYLYAALSKDNGKTWSKSRLVAPLDYADNQGSRGDYPFLCETKDHSVVLFYTRFGLRPGASYEKQHNELVHLDPAYLAQ